jgi:hypothetical protein
VIGLAVVLALVALFGILPAFLPIGSPRIYGPRNGR